MYIFEFYLSEIKILYNSLYIVCIKKQNGDDKYDVNFKFI